MHTHTQITTHTFGHFKYTHTVVCVCVCFHRTHTRTHRALVYHVSNMSLPRFTYQISDTWIGSYMGIWR